MPEGSPLVLPGRLGLIGDAHGNETFLANAIVSLVDAGAELLVQLGDFGVLFDGSAAEMAAVARIETLLGLVDRQLWVIPGNHDPYDLIAALPWGGSLSHASEHIAYVARGARATGPSGRTVLFVSGAGSVDRYSRTEGRSWWPGEEITEDDVTDAVEGGRVDVLLGHEAPSSLALGERIAGGVEDWGAPGIVWANQVQQRFDRIHRSVAPQLSVSGHYHVSLDTTEQFDGPDGAFGSRSVVLDMEGRDGSAAVLDLDGISLEFVSTRLGDERLRQFRADLRAAGLPEDVLAERLQVPVRVLRQLRNGHVGIPTELSRRARGLAGKPWAPMR